MTSGVKYDVDPNEVRALAAGLSGVRQAIEQLARPETRLETRLRSCPDPGGGPELGSLLVAQALDDVGRGWSRARAGIGEQLDLLSRAAKTAADAYAAAEDGVTCALAGR